MTRSNHLFLHSLQIPYRDVIILFFSFWLDFSDWILKTLNSHGIYFRIKHEYKLMFFPFNGFLLNIPLAS